MRESLLLGFALLIPGVAFAQDAVKMPLSEWEKAKRELAALQENAARGQNARRVVVGETIYRGRSDGRNLHLQLRLRAQLADTADFKDVEVLGTDAVIVSAKHRGQPIALVPSGDRWVWTTKERGPVELEIELVVPPRGPRGSIEYRFGVVESPVTELVAFFPTPGLSPQVSGAVTNQVREVRGGTELAAVLSPARELHVVGFHDVDRADPTREAKLYGETENLVSISDDGVELFSVVSLTILYAPQRRFRIALPDGYTLVSADGEGAFQYTLETEGGRTVLVGETAFGITQRYEISLRLERPLAAGETRVTLPVPRLLDVERDSGFVAVEIPGKISIAGVEGDDFTGIDVRELPEAILRSSVSPVVRAFRYSGERKDAIVSLARHPEKALAAGGVDVLRATSVVTGDGRVMTDLLFTIRNNLQQYLALELPPGAEVRSAVLDGDPIKPSRDAEGRVLVPLRRSKSGPSGLQPFRVQLVYESGTGALGAIGRRALALPRLLVPIASLDWSVYVPGTYTTASISGAIGSQRFIKNAQWHRGIDDGSEAFEETEALEPYDEGAGFEDEAGEEEDSPPEQAVAPPTPAGDRASGAMPVRVQLPRDGRLLRTQRFWIEPAEEVEVALHYVRTPLPLVAGLIAVLAAAVLLATGLARGLRRGRLAAGLVLALCAGVVWSASAAVLAVALAAAGILALRSGGEDPLSARAKTWARGFAEVARARAASAWTAFASDFETRRARSLPLAISVAGARVAWIGAKLLMLAVLGTVLLVQLARLVALLQNPL